MKIENKVLDLSDDSKLSEEDSKVLDSQIDYSIDKFNLFVSRLIKANKLSGKDLFLNVSSRDTSTSKTFDICSKLNLIKLKNQQGHTPKLIKVTDEVFARLIEINYEQLGFGELPEVIYEKKQNLFFRIIKNFFVTFYLFIVCWIIFKLPRKNNIPSSKITLVDNFIFKDSFAKDGYFYDRYYSGFEKFLSIEEQTQVWFSPTLIDIKNPLDFIKILIRSKKSKFNFIFEESWLTISDLKNSLFSSLKSSQKIKKIPDYEGLDLSPLIEENLKRDIFSPGFAKAMNKYQYFRRIKKRGIKINGFLNWFENQTIDRAFNLSAKKFYPDVTTIGYQGYIFPKYELHKNPIDLEIELNTIPNFLALISEREIEKRKKFSRKINFILAPALRYSYLENIQYKEPLNDLILFPLPIDINQSIQLINFADQIDRFFDKEVEIVLKCHPKFSIKEFKALVPASMNDKFFFSEESIEKLLTKASLVVSSASTVCIEAASVGIPVAIISNSSGLTRNPLPVPTENDLWAIIYNESDLSTLINKANKQEKKLNNNFFQKVEKSTVRTLFFFNNEIAI
tara:strand:- start:22066 stop:23766 length:1701 start_codon:yes stop_codon:yes gene_type:complete